MGKKIETARLSTKPNGLFHPQTEVYDNHITLPSVWQQKNQEVIIMSIIKEIFADYVQSGEYIEQERPESLRKLSDDVKAVCGNIFPDEVFHLVCEHEEYGFANGFRYAMRIMAECVPEKTAVAV